MKYLKHLLILTVSISILSLNSCDDSNNDENDEEVCDDFTVKVQNWTNNFNAEVIVNDGSDPYSYDYLWSNGDTGTIIGGSEGTLTPGTYTVTVTDANNCSETAFIEISYALPTIEESNVDCFNDKQAWITAKVTDDGGDEITERGVCYSLTSNPTIDDTKIIDNTGGYTFTTLIEPLVSGSTYFARAYAINSVGVSYGTELSFKTNTEASPYSIGQHHAGGIIAWISCDGLHGFVTTETDLHDTNTWTMANSYCNGLVYNGYSDWYLPNATQVRAMKHNLHENGLGNFHTGSTIYDNYWTSFHNYDTSECGNYKSFYIDFDSSDENYLSVCYHLQFRAVRDF